nr:MAG: putative RNA-dependent RNA polymerase [Botoulivirus sp.]
MSKSTMNGNARCSASGSLVNALNRAITVTAREFSLTSKTPVIRPGNCSSIRAQWKRETIKWRNALNLRTTSDLKLKAMLKSCDRLFDRRCKDCDFGLSELAKEQWKEKMSQDVIIPPADWCFDRFFLLKERIRELSAGWGSRLEVCRQNGLENPIYVPDQQGCLEVRREEGGTWSCAPNECEERDNVVRLGVAKTKGKARVVTMQSARVKRVLTPVHNALYDHISSFGWCVRGDIKEEDLRRVAEDRRDGESFISGDYESATDNIFVETVRAIVEVLCEDRNLTPMERDVLSNSFQNVHYRTCTGRLYPIKRGSMMGNLVSFPLLCLLNKACFDIVSDLKIGWGSNRVGRFNGDDCCFCGDESFMRFWREVTSSYGLIVNKEKTGFSREWIELNSRSYNVRDDRFVPKPVLSFLRPARDDSESDLLANVLESVRGLRREVQIWVVNCLMRAECSMRGVHPETYPREWTNYLLKRKWFRGAMGYRCETVETGVKREVPVVIGPPPNERYYDWVTSRSRELECDNVRRWLGVRVEPFNSRFLLDHKSRSKPVSRDSAFRWKVGRAEWAFVWPRAVWEIAKDLPGCVLSPSERRTTWLADHPFLTVRRCMVRQRPRWPFHSYSKTAPGMYLKLCEAWRWVDFVQG